MAPMIENGWHDLPCGARIRVLNGEALAMVIPTWIDPLVGALPPTDAVALKEADDLMGHRVEFTSPWESDMSNTCKVAKLKRKLMLDEPEQL